jgi:hypothetical protein
MNPDLRFSSPAQLALIGLGVWIVGVLVPSLHILGPLGLGLLLLAGASQLLKPKRRPMTWRGRTFDVAPEPTGIGRLYRTVFRD